MCNVYQKKVYWIKTIHRIILVSIYSFLYLEVDRNGLTCKLSLFD